MTETSTTYVNILDKEYQVACPPEEKIALNRAAADLDKRLRDIRSSGVIVGLERIAVMAALNLCHELQESDTHIAPPDQEIIDRMTKKLDAVLLNQSSEED